LVKSPFSEVAVAPVEAELHVFAAVHVTLAAVVAPLLSIRLLRVPPPLTVVLFQRLPAIGRKRIFSR
jgi:hypothetical protein